MFSRPPYREQRLNDFLDALILQNGTITGKSLPVVEASELLVHAVRQDRLLRRMRVVLGIFCGLAFCTSFLLDRMPHTAGYGLPIRLATIYLCGLGMLTTVATTEKQTVSAIEPDDRRSIGTLAQALEFREPQTRHAAAEALIKMLPTLRAEDAVLLDPHARRCLHRALRNEDTRFVLTTLKALTQVGDETALFFLDRLIMGPKRASDVNIRKAARVCLYAIYDRLDQTPGDRYLLRPSQAPDHIEALLRPLQHPGLSEVDHLLRPQEPGGDSE